MRIRKTLWYDLKDEFNRSIDFHNFEFSIHEINHNTIYFRQISLDECQAIVESFH